MKNRYVFIFLFFVCIIPVLLPLFQSGFFQTDDGEWMIIRFSAFHQALRDGQFPVRFLHRLNFGYGYPVADFLYPGFMYLGEVLKLVGFGFIDVIKITFGITLIESGVFTFFWLSKLFKRTPAFIGSLVYLYFPYHLFDVYKRGSVGESLALAVVPFILWQIERKNILWISFGIALLVLSHNTLAVLFLPLIIIYGFLRHSTFNILHSTFFGLGLPAFFWIPALYDLQYTLFNTIQVSDWRQYFTDLKLLGYSTMFIYAATVVSFYIRRKEKYKRLPLYFFVVGVITIFFSTSISIVFWEVLPVSFVQFPFRFLSVVMLCVAFLSAFVFSQISYKVHVVFVGVLIFLLFIDAKPFLTSIQYFDKGDLYYATNEATTTVKDEYMPVWVKEKPIGHFKNKVEILNGSGKVENLVFNNKKIHFDAVMETSGMISINTVYFPGWKVFINSVEEKILYKNPKGIIQVILKPGSYKIDMVFEETSVRLVSDIVSLGSFIGLIFVVISTKKNSVLV